MNKTIIRLIIFTIGFMAFLGCETKKYNNPEGSNFNGLNIEGKFVSEISFNGLDSISTWDDSTAQLNWTTHSDATSYSVFTVDGNNLQEIKVVNAPATGVKLTGLKSNTSYTFRVRAKDADKHFDGNSNDLSILTFSAPLPPTLLLRTSPSFLTDVNMQPTFTVYGVNEGDTVTLYRDTSCTNEVGSALATSTTVSIKSSKLPSHTSYTFKAKRKNINGETSICSIVSNTYTTLQCPEGYAYVDYGTSLGVDSFCVMKHEARAWIDMDNDNRIDGLGELDGQIDGNHDGCNEAACTSKNWGTALYKPGSTYNGKPWRMIDFETARTECRSLGSGYDLITNKEWIALGHLLEGVNENWTGNAPGNGCLKRGNNGVADACGYALNAVDGGLIRDAGNERHKLYINFAQGIYVEDLAGNLSEWIDYDIDDVVQIGPRNCSDNWQEISSSFCDGEMPTYLFMPLNPGTVTASSYNSTYGLGKAHGGLGGFMLRGGGYLHGTNAGLFGFTLGIIGTSANERRGFRCVYRPEK